MEAMARIDRGFHHQALAEWLEIGINETKPFYVRKMELLTLFKKVW